MPGNQLVTWTQFYKDIDALVKQVKASEKEYDFILAVTRGGMIPAYYIAKMLDLPVKTVNISSYTDQQIAGKVTHVQVDGFTEIVQNPHGCLLVDDMHDTGETMNYVQDRFSGVDTACLYTRHEGHNLTYVVKTLNHEQWIDFPWEVMWDGEQTMYPQGL